MGRLEGEVERLEGEVQSGREKVQQQDKMKADMEAAAGMQVGGGEEGGEGVVMLSRLTW